MRNTITNSTRIITKRSCNSLATDTNERYKWLWWLRFPETTRWRATDGIFDAFFNESPTTDEKSPLCLFPFSRRSVVSLIDRKRSQVFRLFFASFFFSENGLRGFQSNVRHQKQKEWRGRPMLDALHDLSLHLSHWQIVSRSTKACQAQASDYFCSSSWSRFWCTQTIVGCLELNHQGFPVPGRKEIENVRLSEIYCF